MSLSKAVFVSVTTVTTCFLGYSTTLFKLLRLRSVEWEMKITSNGKKATISQRMDVAHFRILH